VNDMDHPPSYVLENVSVDFPIYSSDSRTIRKSMLGAAIPTRRMEAQQGIHVVRALRNISLTIETGSSLGLIGFNGAGKSTLLKVLAGVLEPTRGQIARHGSVNALLNIGAGMSGDLTGEENIRRVGLLRGFSTAEINTKLPEIVAFADIGEFIHLPVRTYSSGMRMRLSFAIATAKIPDILLIDEVFNAGDSAFRNRASKRIKTLIADAKTFVLSSHSKDILMEFCKKCIYLEEGRIKTQGSMDSVMTEYGQDIKKRS